MMPDRFEERMAVTWCDPEGVPHYGVIMSAKGLLEVAEVLEEKKDTKCYNDGGSIYARDRDNVRLTEYPPFSLLRLISEKNSCYVLAGMQDRIFFGADDVSERGLFVIDDGDKICGADFDAIKDHPWRDEKERSKNAVLKAAYAFADAQKPAVPPVPGPSSSKQPSAMERMLAMRKDEGKAPQADKDDWQPGC